MRSALLIRAVKAEDPVGAAGLVHLVARMDRAFELQHRAAPCDRLLVDVAAAGVNVVEQSERGSVPAAADHHAVRADDQIRRRDRGEVDLGDVAAVLRVVVLAVSGVTG